MSINVRKATSSDASFLARMILKSTRASKKIGLFDLIFNASSDEEMISLIEKLTNTTHKSSCHYSNFLIAEMDGQCVGTLCSYEPRIATKEVFLNALFEIGIDASENECLRVLNICGFEPNNKILVFDYMQEVDGFVDVGVLKVLMQKSLLNARLKGYRLAQTVVETGSLETLMYYKKLGFREVEQKECEAYKELFGRVGLTLLSIEF